MYLHTWDFGGGRLALYSDDGEAWKAARAAGLAEVAEYRRRDGRIVARQFAGEKEKVLELVKRLKKAGKGA